MPHSSGSSAEVKKSGSGGLIEVTGWAASRTVRQFEKAVARAEEVIRAGGEAVGGVAETVGQETRRLFQDTDTRPYEERTKEELYAIAVQRGIRGRSAMRKSELIAALRSGADARRSRAEHVL